MQNLMLNFMQDYWTDEDTILYSEIMDLISGVHEDWPDNIDLFFNSIGDDYTIDMITERLKDMVQEMLINLLQDIGVFISEDYPINNETLFSIYKEFISIEANEQTEFALSILESDRDDIVVFYELLNVVGTLTIDESEFNSHIVKISPYTRNKLIAYLRGKMSVSIEEEINDNTAIINSVKEFIEKTNDENYLVVDLIRKGISVGLTFKSYMDLYSDQLFDLPIKEQCYNLYLFALISEEGQEGPADYLSKIISNYIFDFGEADIVLRAVREIQIKLR